MKEKVFGLVAYNGCEKDKAKCNHCDGLLSRRSGTIRTHLEKCRKFKLTKKELDEDDDLDRLALSTSTEPPKKKRLDSYVTRTSPDQMKQLGLQDSFFSLNLSRNGNRCVICWVLATNLLGQ